ncbi:MAG TPA: hypothetical protein VK797_09285 [Tepidisphaeraceae bacterium]|nr:hypothetical protein [Tepidisphaeraceae bacterium]
MESLAMFVRSGNWLKDAAIANGALAHYTEAPGRSDDPRQRFVRNSQRLQWVSGQFTNRAKFIQARAWPRIVKISFMQSARYDNSNGAV